MCATCHRFIKVLTFALVAWPCLSCGTAHRALISSIPRRAASFLWIRSSSVGGPRLSRESATLKRSFSRHASGSRVSLLSQYHCKYWV